MRKSIFLITLVLGVILLSGCASTKHAYRKIFDSLLDDSGSAFDSSLSAVIAASDRYNPRSIEEDKEYMGAILYDGESFSYTVTAGKPRQADLVVRVKVPVGSKIVAWWHTHASPGTYGKRFSRNDIELVRLQNVPFYMADPYGHLRVLKPGDRIGVMIGLTGSRLAVRYAKGTLITYRDVSSCPSLRSLWSDPYPIAPHHLNRKTCEDGELEE